MGKYKSIWQHHSHLALLPISSTDTPGSAKSEASRSLLVFGVELSVVVRGKKDHGRIAHHAARYRRDPSTEEG